MSKDVSSAYTAGRNHVRKHFLSFTKVNYAPATYELAILLLRVYPSEMKGYTHKHLYMKAHNDLIYKIAQTINNPNVHQQVNE